MKSCAAVIALTLAASLPAIAQPAPGGVYVDSDGVVKTRETKADKRLRDLRDAARKSKERGELCFVSLPRLFADVRKKLDAGEKLSDDLRFLKGLTKLRYVFVYPDEKDVVIAGTAEPIDTDFPGRPVGKRTGRPALQLDDLVVALRACGPGHAGSAFGCSIDASAEGDDRRHKEYEKWKNVIETEPKRRREAYDAIAKAAGPQPVRFFNIPADTRFAWVCLEADFILKRHSLGLDPTPVKDAPSLMDLVKSQMSVSDRAWFEACYDPLQVSEDGRAFEIAGPSLAIKSRRPLDDGKEGEPHPISKKYAERLTKHFPEMCREIPAWADLANLADLALLAALIRSDSLHEKAGWDLAWILKDYPVATVPTAKSVDTLINFRDAGDFLVVISGGVMLSMDELAKARDAKPKPDLAKRSRRPDKDWSAVSPDE